VVNSHGRFVWYELVTTDIKAAVAFYSKVMGWNAWDVSAPGKDYILFGDGKGSIAGLMRLPDDVRQRGGEPAWLGYVGVDDVDATVARLTRLGGSVDVPPTDASGISRFSVCADPQRARLALFKWLKPEQQPQTGPDEPGRVGWHELLAADPEQAWAFYAELFGWQKEDADRGAERPYRFFSAGGVTIGSILAKPEAAAEAFWLYYFNVGDIDATLRRITAGGGEILEGPLEMPGGTWIARCTDPQGAMFALEGARKASPVGYFVPADRK